MTADRWSRVRRRLLAPRTFLTSGAVLLAVAMGFAISSVLAGGALSGGVRTQGQPSLVSYSAQASPDETASASSDVSFTIAGNASQVLYPAKTSTIDLAFTNPSNTAITLPAGAIGITITSPKPMTCPVSRNFTDQTLTSAVTIQAHATDESLAEMKVTPHTWPSITMLTTHVNQDGCEGITLTLTYSVTVTSTGTVTKATTGSGTGSGSRSGASPPGPSPVPVHTATASSSTALAFTGFDVLLAGGSGVLLVVLGLGLLMWRRRVGVRR